MRTASAHTVGRAVRPGKSVNPHYLFAIFVLELRASRSSFSTTHVSFARAAAAFTGARRGELRGFLWQNYDGDQIFVSQPYWRSHVDEPKTKKSWAPVLVIAQLAERINLHRKLSGNSPAGL